MDRNMFSRPAGAALVSVMLALVVLSAMSIAIANLTMSNTGVVVSTSDRQQALLLAQAGINMAISKVALKGLSAIPNKTNTINTRWGFNHIVQVDKEPVLDASGNPTNDVRLVARGIILNKQGAGANQVIDASDLDLDGVYTDVVVVAQRRIEGILHPTSGAGAYVYGAFGDLTLRFNSSNAIADSYDARGIPIMKKLNDGVDGLPNTADDVFVPELGLFGYDGISGTDDDVESRGPDGVLGTTDDLLFPLFVPATYNQQAIASPRIKGDGSNTGPGRPRPYTYLDPITLAPTSQTPTTAQITAFHSAGQAGSFSAVGTNGANGITIGNSSTIYGIAVNGPGSTQTIGGTVTGGKSIATTTLELTPPSTTPPTTITASWAGNPPASIGTGTFTATAWPTGDYNVTGDAVVYLSGDLRIDNDDRIVIQPGATLTVYQSAGTFLIRNGAELNVLGQQPNAFNLVSSSADPVTLRGPTAGLFATVYAPNALVDIAGNGDIHGAIIGKSVDVTGSGKFHWDRSARSPGIKTTVSLVAYREID